MNYYEHHLGDYAKDTGHLTMLEHGAYRTLLDRYYSTEQGIPANQAYRLARARSEEECRAVDVVLEEFFELVDGVWIQNRVEHEIGLARKRITAAQENGKKGGRPKSKPNGSDSETQQKPSGLSVGSDLETQQKAHHLPSTHLPIKNKAAATITAPELREASDDPPPLPSSEPSKPTSLDNSAGYAVLVRRWEKERGKASTVTSSDPRLAVWAQKLVTEAQLREAYDLAVADRELAQDPGPINAGFLDVFLAKVLKPPGGDSALNRQPSAAPPKHWAVSWSGIVAKGEELGIVQEAGELAPTFKARVFAAAQLSDDEKAMLRADYGVSV